jgi:mannosyl-oligosaccharide alpha-1,2-mannosidase
MTPLLRRWGILCLISFLGMVAFWHLDSVPYIYSDPGQPSSFSQLTGKLKPGFQWKSVPIKHPVTKPMKLPDGSPKKLPRVQHKFQEEDPDLKKKREGRRDKVKEVFLRSWNAYKQKAWLHDELKPIYGGHKDTFGGWGASLVDSLDMLAILGLEDDLRNATDALNQIDFNSSKQRDLNVFETTIRYLGGFLAAYDISEGKYPALLEKAIDLGNMLYMAFDTPNRMPIARWDWLQ